METDFLLDALDGFSRYNAPWYFWSSVMQDWTKVRTCPHGVGGDSGGPEKGAGEAASLRDD
jgi:hypothetical protein